ncbi:MAG: hypothetical protein ACRDTH_17395 [Pseudonocardiaceae bacterium]
MSGSENGVVSVRAAADPAVSFALDARIEDLLPSPAGRISVATNRGVAVVEVRFSAKGFACPMESDPACR